LIGKWHLGDNHPCRPQDQGFDHVDPALTAAAWAMAPDYWENDYYDDTFKVNGEWKQFEGYCTDVWFDEAIRYIEENARQAVFPLHLPPTPRMARTSCRIPTPPPTAPPACSETLAKFYGMITCIDENLGRFRARLAELGLAENTLLIFMTDNGTTAGWIDQELRRALFQRRDARVEIIRLGGRPSRAPLLALAAGGTPRRARCAALDRPH
jgi:arylsulfatase A-like enzyme